VPLLPAMAFGDGAAQKVRTVRGRCSIGDARRARTRGSADLRV